MKLFCRAVYCTFLMSLGSYLFALYTRHFDQEWRNEHIGKVWLLTYAMILVFFGISFIGEFIVYTAKQLDDFLEKKD